MSAAQNIPTETIALNRGAADITGEKFGELTALKPVERSQRGNVWLMRCNCGRFAVRTVAKLRSAVKQGSAPCCQECVQELRSGYFQEQRARHRETLLARIASGYSLYSERELAQIERDIRARLLASGIPPAVERFELPVRVDPAWMRQPDPEFIRRQREQERRDAEQRMSRVIAQQKARASEEEKEHMMSWLKTQVHRGAAE